MTPDSPNAATHTEKQIAPALGKWQQTLGREWTVRRAISTVPWLIWSVPVAVLIGITAGMQLGIAVIILAALLWACWSLVQLLNPPTLPHVAETLDLRGSTKNRIATALCFEQRGTTDLFERAAIQDGNHALTALTQQQAQPEPNALPWRQSIAAALLAVVLLLSPDIPSISHRLPDDAVTPGATVAISTTDEPADLTQPRTDSTNRPTTNRSTQQSAESTRSTRTTSPDQPKESDQTSPGRASAAHAAAGTGATASAGSGQRESESAPNQSQESNKPSSQSKKTSPGSREAGSPSDNAMPSGSGRSGGASFSVKNDWVKNIRTAASSQTSADETESDEPEDETVDDQQQRGGAQPAARDRNVAPSRQLGISGPKGPPGSGRGGPTPVKKSRGTAAMLLGVPTPELVEGQSRPGPVQRTFRRVTPPQQDDTTNETTGPINNDPVWQINTQRWDEREARFVSDYLAALRREPTE